MTALHRIPALAFAAVALASAPLSATDAATVYRPAHRGHVAHVYSRPYAHHRGRVYGYHPGHHRYHRYGYDPGAALAMGVIGGILGAATAYPSCDYGFDGNPYGCPNSGYYGPYGGGAAFGYGAPGYWYGPGHYGHRYNGHGYWGGHPVYGQGSWGGRPVYGRGLGPGPGFGHGRFGHVGGGMRLH